MPYLDQGEFYAEFGSFNVQITLPAEYVVAATGTCENEHEALTVASLEPLTTNNEPITVNRQRSTVNREPSTVNKTLRYHIDSVHDFAFFADKRFRVSQDTVQLDDGSTIQTRVFSLPVKKGRKDPWAHAQAYLKKAIRFHSAHTGPYPYRIVSVVEGTQGIEGGMEYPTITILNGIDSDESLESVIVHEVGHNWFQGILGTNERKSPWMDEGLNSYFDRRYEQAYKGVGPRLEGVDAKAKPTPYPLSPTPSYETLFWKTLASLHMDQPIRTSADKFNKLNYVGIAYGKSGDWFQAMEKLLGRERFDSCIQAYYRQYQFTHPQEEDLLRIFRQAGDSEAAALIAKLDQTGPIQHVQRHGLNVKFFGSLKETDKTHNLFITPLPGYNMYDGLMLGAMFHNYTLPLARFRYAIAPMYGFRSKQLNAIGNINYSLYPASKLHEIRLMLDGAKFTMDEFWPENEPRMYQSFTKLSPGIRLEWKNRDARQTVIKSILLKSFFIGEDQLQFSRDTVNDVDLVRTERTNYNIHQLTVAWENYRVLYPWKAELRAELGQGFGRLGFTGNYFFNFRKKGGVALRAYAGKFFYTVDRTSEKVFETDRFHLNMTGPKGYEDYTYSNYFVGRNAFEGFPSQQIMVRDGAFKVRTDLLGEKVGKTDNWLASINAVMDVPDRFNILNVLPVKIPLKIFADLGTYAEAWDEENQDARVIFDAGLQFSFLKNTVHLYMPLVYSKVYKDYFNSTPGNGFWQRISFSMDLHLLNARKQLSASF